MKPVQATHIDDKEEFRERRIAGSFRISAPMLDEPDGHFTFWYCCPCGCGAIGPLSVGVNFKPADIPSWQWNGSVMTPDLKPSINHKGHWHGYLTDGVWRDA